MENNEIQAQITELNKKMDLILNHMHAQQQKSEVVEDLLDDLSIVSRDAYKSTVEELDHQGIELDIDELKMLMYKFMRNIGNISTVIDTFESLNDFIKDAGPIANELGIEATHKLYEFEQRGYFDYLNELTKLLGELHKHYTVDDLREMAENIDIMMTIVKNISSTDMLKRAEKATAELAEIKPEKQDQKSMLGLIRMLSKAETRKSLAYSIRLLNTITQA